ncbi:MAG TPA: prephenate dehydrogenase/arogenate dehydrogenase family protein [Solirubrobacteraceae bacterium]|nr:prephenate dehydrogenase/arogenate dehydrogenase family protein [Solirubrobacteraceae bacterium]
MKVAVLGVGLIGGSIGLAASRRAGAHVVGYDPDASVLSRAVELGAIDELALEIAEAVGDADVVFVAAPVGASTSTALLALDAAGGECVVSDVGSTKREIVRAISDPRFVGGHPLAGAETAGVENARDDLFDGATWYLTPAAAASPAAAATPPSAADDPSPAVARLRELIGRFGARAVAIDPDAHDRLMASVSHLPHVLANVLVAQAAGAVEDDARAATSGMLGAGPSFRDATRVAGANTAIWVDIYLSNRDALVEAIDEAIGRLGEVRMALADGDSGALAAWNERARAEREQLRRAGLAPGS